MPQPDMLPEREPGPDTQDNFEQHASNSGLDPRSVADDAFRPDNIDSVMLLTLLRIQDYVSVIAGALDPEGTDALEELHDRGGLISPPPWLAGPEESDDEEPIG
jgi:hypothetical protein